MKKLLLGVAVVSFFFGVSNLAYAADKLAYVDLTRIFSDYQKTKDYDKALTDKQTLYDTERGKKVEEIKEIQEKLNLLSDKEKEAKKSDLDSKVKLLQDFDRQQQTDLRKEQDEKMKEILKDIEATVKQIAEKDGYSLVFNDRVFIYQNKSLDITDEVIKALNKRSKK